MIPIHLLGELVSSDSKCATPFLNSSISRILWTMTLSFAPSHLVFEPDSSKLFICNHQGYISIYTSTTSCLSLTDSFFLEDTEKSSPTIIKSLTASKNSLAVILNSSIQSILHLYSHHGSLLHALSFFNEYISQIRFDDHHLWCLELISSSLFYFPIQLNQLIDEKTRFISFEPQSFNPFRFALNRTFVVIMDRASTGILLLYDKQTTSYLRQIKYPLINIEPYDIELTNQLLIYRLPHEILLTQIDNEQFLERINAKKNLNITIGKSDTEILFSTSTDDKNTFLIQCYVK
jgi:hypothetical protein